jgi:hypothetical protein
LELEVKNTADDKESIKRPYKAEYESRKADVIVIMECLSDPCPGFYTDSLSQSLLVVCKDPKHTSTTSNSHNNENGDGKK